MSIIKRLLFIILGKRRYLLLVSRTFLFMYRVGILKLFRKFDTHYMASKIISEGDTVIDIGANVGYYSTLFARSAGAKGRVISIEPVAEYREILGRNCRNFSNIEILPYALGDHNGRVRMAIPDADKTRHGLTRVIDHPGRGEMEETWEVEMRNTEELFADIVTVNYIKIDIEGYEDRVIPGLYGLIEKSRPVIQIELALKNFEKINRHLMSLGYSGYHAVGKKLLQISSGQVISNDIVYMTENSSGKHQNVIHNNIKT